MSKKHADTQHIYVNVYFKFEVLMAPVTRGYWERNSVSYQLVQKVTYVTVGGSE